MGENAEVALDIQEVAYPDGSGDEIAIQPGGAETGEIGLLRRDSAGGSTSRRYAGLKIGFQDDDCHFLVVVFLFTSEVTGLDESKIRDLKGPSVSKHSEVQERGCV